MARTSLEARRAVLGEEHPGTLTNTGNLASTYRESRTVEGDGRAGRASDGDKKEGARAGASTHADQHGQSGARIEVTGLE